MADQNNQDEGIPADYLGDALKLLGGGAIAGTILPKGYKLWHGSPNKNLTFIRPSLRGPLGQGVYASDYQNIAGRYAGKEGKLYEIPEQPDIYLGHGARGSDELYYGIKNDRQRLIEAADPDKRDEVANIVGSPFSDQEGYRQFWDLSRLYGDKEKAQELYKKAGFQGLSGQVDGPEFVLFKGQYLEPGATPKDFYNLGDQQRGDPEHAMVKAQMVMGGGVANPVIEHSGDLVHRMTQWAPQYDFGYGNVNDKVGKVISWLKNPYGFEREFNQNMVNNASARGIPLDEHKIKVDAALRRFGDAHAALPAYNEAHDLANKANVNLGYQNWNKAISNLEELSKYLNDRDTWNEFASRGLKR